MKYTDLKQNWKQNWDNLKRVKLCYLQYNVYVFMIHVPTNFFLKKMQNTDGCYMQINYKLGKVTWP